MSAPFSHHGDDRAYQLHSNTNVLSCQMRGLVTLAQSLGSGEPRNSDAEIRVQVARLANALSEFWTEIGNLADGGRSNADGSPESFQSRALAKSSANRKEAAARRTALDAGFHSSVGA